jgi:hypothetical protein
MKAFVGPSGSLGVKKISAPKPPLSWQLRQWFRRDRIGGLILHGAAHAFSKVFKAPVMIGKLSAVHITADGKMTNYGVLSRRLVTTAFVNDMVDELIAETSTWGDYKYHDSGVGVTGAAVGDTDIETTDGESRATGTQVENAANIYESVGTITYTTTKAITEHGLFNNTTGATLMDRHTFTAINVVNTDSIQFTYDLTVTAGG